MVGLIDVVDVVVVQVCSVGLNILVRVAVQTCHIAYTQLCAGGEKGRGACQVRLPTGQLSVPPS